MYATLARPNRGTAMAVWIHGVAQHLACAAATGTDNPAHRTSRRACDREDDALVVHTVIRSLVVDQLAWAEYVYRWQSRLLIAELFTWSLCGICLRPFL